MELTHSRTDFFMLISLHIKNFAIIDGLEVEFAPGFNVMTGETGAGKTIIAQALLLVMGGRAQSDTIRAGKDSAEVSAVFDAKKISQTLKKHLEEIGIEFDDELIIARTVSALGRSRISINGALVTAAQLKFIGEHLVDISSQHEHQMLLDESEHVGILDAYGGHDSEIGAWNEEHAEWIKLLHELAKIEENEKSAKEKLDYLKFQLKELKDANLKPGENIEIEAERVRLKHARLLEEKSRLAEAALYGDAGSALEMIDRAAALVSDAAQFEPKAALWREALLRSRAELSDTSRDIAAYAETLESNPARLEDLEDRLHLIRGLLKKHGGSIEACIARRDELEKEIGLVERYDEIIAEKREALAQVSAKRKTAGEKLSAARKTAARGMSKAVAKELSGLGMGKTSFHVEVGAKPENIWDETGCDDVKFLISPNAGEPLRAMARIASGGELSRTMLALKCALSGRCDIATTSVFDEVDAGIGGAVAEVVGKKLKSVADSRQVICITHLPQIAAFGERHFRISKSVVGKRTVAAVENLSRDARVDEIARMLGGVKITDATVEHAKEMLNSVVRRA